MDSGKKTIAPLTAVEISTYYRARLPDLVQDGAEWRCPCPLHQGERNSFAVNAETGKWNCHAECGGGYLVGFEAKLNNIDKKAAWKAVCEVIGRDSMRPVEVSRRIVATYDYVDADGKLVYQVVREEPKHFFQRHRNPEYKEGGTEKQWINTTKGLPKLLYRLPQVIASDSVYVVEGEKDVASAEALGLVATCNVGGAHKSVSGSKWLPVFNKFFKGKHVVILPDQDETGQMHAGAVARGVAPVAASVKVVNLPAGKDITEWIAAGRTAEALAALVQDTPLYVAPCVALVPGTAAGWEAFLPLVDRPSDGANGEIFARFHGDVARYVPSFKKWIVWRSDQGRWAADDSLLIHQLAVAHLRNMRQAATDLHNNDLMAHAVKSESKGSTDAMIACARALMVTCPDELDTHVYLLNCKNGTVDLKTGELCLHRKSDFMTKLVPLDYDPYAASEEFETFLSEIMCGDQEMVEFLQRFTGYSLCGWVGERKLICLHGENGSNGKSTFRDILKNITGDYYATADFSTFQQARFMRDGSQATPDLARLHGARIVTASEPKGGITLDAGLLKNVTGGDPITARHLNEAPFEFTPQFTLWLIFNPAPKLEGGDNAAWRRVLRVAFDHTYNETPTPADLARKDRLSSAAITGASALAWAVRGSVKYHQDGLKIPEKVTSGTKEYRNDQDSLRDFYADNCVFGENLHWETGPLHAAYYQWALNEHIPESWRFTRRKLTNHLILFKKCKSFESRKDVMALRGIGPITRDEEPRDLVPVDSDEGKLVF